MNEGTLSLDFTVPTAWPPKAIVTVFDGIADGATLRMLANPRGTFQFDVHSGKDHINYETPRLTLPNFAFLKVAFAWGEGAGIRCAINGQLINKATEDPIDLKAGSHPPTGFRSQLTFAVPPACSDVEQSFLRFILDLRGRIGTNDRFNLLEASAILRRLLLDARPVVHLANRVHRQQLRFPFVLERHVKGIDEGPAFTFPNLCPDFADPEEIQMLTLDEFLAKPALKDHERAFTVRDVIDVCANLKGGIHFGEPASQAEESLIKLDKGYLPFFIDASLAALPGIGWATIVGTRSLTEAILGKRMPAGA